MVRNCPKCGAVVDPKAIFCVFCGNKLEHTEKDYEAEKQYEMFYNSCMGLNLDNPQQIHTSWWALLIEYVIINLIVTFIIDGDNVWKILAIEHIICYVSAQALVDFVANKYVGKIIFPKASDTVFSTIDFIEQQLEKNSKKKMFRLRNCIRNEAWLRCLTAIIQRPNVSAEVSRRVKGITTLYPSKKWAACLFCMSLNLLFYVALCIISVLNGY